MNYIVERGIKIKRIHKSKRMIKTVGKIAFLNILLFNLKYEINLVDFLVLKEFPFMINIKSGIKIIGSECHYE